MEEHIMFEPRRNMVAYLDPEGKVPEFNEITRWLWESRINKVITHQTPIYKTLVKEFWDSTNVIEIDGKEVIRAQVKQKNVDVSVEILNTVLQLNDNLEAPDTVPIMCQRGCLLRMKCTYDIFGGKINKIFLSMRYKFLLHILIQCLSNRRSSYDMTCNDLIGLMVALILNKPFSISKYIFLNMKENLRRTGATGHKFWMYPRFLQMIMNLQHLDLSKEANDVLKMMKLFGALGDKNYVAPANDKWRHDESQSDNEEPRLKKMKEDKFGRKKLDIFGDTDSEDNGDDGDYEGGEGGDGRNVGASAASAHGGDDADSGSDDNPPEPGYEHDIDERGIRQLCRVRTDQDQDEDYVPSDTEAADLRKKKQAAIRRKKKMKKIVGTSSSAHVSVQQATVVEPVQEEEASLSDAPQPPPITTSATETPVVTPPVEPQQAGTSSSLRQQSEAHHRSSERRGRLFSEMGLDEKVEFLFSPL
ncbi:hypothetical protein Hanom_Chr02g00111161 [Helianthus anomalus]